MADQNPLGPSKVTLNDEITADNSNFFEGYELANKGRYHYAKERRKAHMREYQKD